MNVPHDVFILFSSPNMSHIIKTDQVLDHPVTAKIP